MSNDSIAESRPASLTGRRAFLRLAGIGIVILAIAGAFLYVGGWFSPRRLTPARFTNGFEQVYGTHSGFRRNHAKGVCVNGFFDSNGAGARLSKAVVFQPGRLPVIGRFSLSGGNPYVADAPDTVRGLGLSFPLADGEEWRTAMINAPVFVVKTPQAFYDRLIATQPDPKTGKPDPGKMAGFLTSHPETGQAARVIQRYPVSSGFENSTYYGLNAFWFVDGSGTRIPVRWAMVPVQPFVPADNIEAGQRNNNFLFDTLIAAIVQHPLQWRLVITIGQPGDPTNDATIPWPEERERVDAGTLTLDHIESEETSRARDINFDPLVLPSGIVPSDDPLLSARSAVYSRSFTRRAGERKEPSAITPSEVRR